MGFLFDFIAQLRFNLWTMCLRIREFFSGFQQKEGKSTALLSFNTTIPSLVAGLVSIVIAIGIWGSKIPEWALVLVGVLLALLVLAFIWQNAYFARKNPEVLRTHVVIHREVRRSSVGDDLQGEIVQIPEEPTRFPAIGPEKGE